jgi:hypothetical protein
VVDDIYELHVMLYHCSCVAMSCCSSISFLSSSIVSSLVSMFALCYILVVDPCELVSCLCLVLVSCLACCSLVFFCVLDFFCIVMHLVDMFASPCLSYMWNRVTMLHLS